MNIKEKRNEILETLTFLEREHGELVEFVRGANNMVINQLMRMDNMMQEIRVSLDELESE